MIVLGIDPGTHRMGFGLVLQEKGKQNLKDYGCIYTSKSSTDEDRLVELYTAVKKLIHTHNPDSIALESLFFTTNAKTAMAVGQARGIVLLACGQEKKPVATYAPLEVKLAVTGYGKAGKTQVQQMVKSILRLSKILKPDDAADAVAIALTHCFSYKLKQSNLL